MRLGLTIPLEGIPAADSIIPIARLAEESGYTDIWTAEVGGADGIGVVAAAASVTSTVRLGTAIVPVFTRPAPLLAMGAATLQAISSGRFVLGLGTSTSIIVGGWMGLDFVRPLSRVRETVNEVREALTGKKVASGFRLSLDPGSPVPIYIAALGPRMLQLAGDIADGVILFLFTPDGAREAIAQTGADFDVVARIPVALDEETEMLKYMLRRLTTTYAMVDVYNASLRRQGFETEAEQISKLWREGDRDGAAAAVTDEMLESLYIFGNLDECASKLEAFRKAGVKTPVLLPISVAGDPAERLQRVRAAITELAKIAL